MRLPAVPAPRTAPSVEVAAAELAAAVLAAVGVRRGDCVLDLAPTAGLSRALIAAAGDDGTVLTVEPGSPAGLPADHRLPFPDATAQRVVLSLGRHVAGADVTLWLAEVARVLSFGGRLLLMSSAGDPVEHALAAGLRPVWGTDIPAAEGDVHLLAAVRLVP